MENVQHLQQTARNSFRLTQIMLLHYPGQFKKIQICCKFETDCK